MIVEVFKSKIHRVKITGAALDYMGSITIDRDLLDAAKILTGEKVQIVNITNGERIETYTIGGDRGSGVVQLNGAAARKMQKGDIVIIIAYAQMSPEQAKNFSPTVIFPDEKTNKLL